MLFVKYLLITGGFGILFTAAGILVWDLYVIFRPRPLSIASDEAIYLAEEAVRSVRYGGGA